MSPAKHVDHRTLNSTRGRTVYISLRATPVEVDEVLRPSRPVSLPRSASVRDSRVRGSQGGGLRIPAAFSFVGRVAVLCSFSMCHDTCMRVGC